MPYRNINSKILTVIPRPKTAYKDGWFLADNSPNLIAINRLTLDVNCDQTINPIALLRISLNCICSEDYKYVQH